METGHNTFSARGDGGRRRLSRKPRHERALEVWVPEILGGVGEAGLPQISSRAAATPRRLDTIPAPGKDMGSNSRDPLKTRKSWSCASTSRLRGHRDSVMRVDIATPRRHPSYLISTTVEGLRWLLFNLTKCANNSSGMQLQCVRCRYDVVGYLVGARTRIISEQLVCERWVRHTLDTPHTTEHCGEVR